MDQLGSPHVLAPRAKERRARGLARGEAYDAWVDASPVNALVEDETRAEDEVLHVREDNALSIREPTALIETGLAREGRRKRISRSVSLAS